MEVPYEDCAVGTACDDVFIVWSETAFVEFMVVEIRCVFEDFDNFSLAEVDGFDGEPICT